MPGTTFGAKTGFIRNYGTDNSIIESHFVNHAELFRNYLYSCGKRGEKLKAQVKCKKFVEEIKCSCEQRFIPLVISFLYIGTCSNYSGWIQINWRLEISQCAEMFSSVNVWIFPVFLSCVGNKFLGKKKKNVSGGFVLYEQIECTIVIYVVSNYC